jgi:hypothetical protein
MVSRTNMLDFIHWHDRIAVSSFTLTWELVVCAVPQFCGDGAYMLA